MINVLVVEDSRVVLEYLVYLIASDPDLRVMGTAGDGETAIKFLTARRPAVILMDIHMPGIDGIEATRRITAGGVVVKVPAIILLSASGGGEGERALALEAGAVSFLQKPVTGSTLFDAIVTTFAPALIAAGCEDRAENRLDSGLEGALVLLVEDNDMNQEIAMELLHGAGMEVTVANNGREAIERLEEPLARFDLVLMDIQMPEMDGYEVAARLKQNPAWASIPILVVTSYAQSGDRHRAMALGISDYLEKPFEPADFLVRVRRLLPPETAP